MPLPIILIINDNPEDSARLDDCLTSGMDGRYQILKVGSGNAAIESGLSEAPDCILLDLYSPHIDALALLASLKDRDGHLRFPVVALIGPGNTVQLTAEFMKQGIQDFLTKDTITPEILRYATANTIEKHRLYRELRRRDAELHASDEVLRMQMKVMDHINDAVMITEANNIDPPGPRILYVNPAFERMTGYSSLEALGQTPRMLQGEKTDRGLLNRIRATLQSQETIRVELTNYRKDGTEFESELEIVPGWDDNDKITHFISIQRDVTERNRSIATLYRDNERLEKIVATSPGAIHSFRISAEGTQSFPYSSSKIHDIFGLQPGDIKENAAALFSRIHPDDLPHVQAAIGESARTLGPWQCEFRVQNPDKGVLWVDVHSMPVQETDGSTMWYGTITDNTRKKLSELARLQSDAQLTGIISSAMDAIICIDDSQRIVLYNAAAEQMFRCPVAYALGQPLERFIPESLPVESTEHIQEIGRSGNNSNPSYGLRSNGEKFPIEASLSQIKNGADSFYTVIVRDITKRKQAEKIAARQTTVLIQTLGLLKTLPEMDAFLRAVLMALTECLSAVSASLWLYKEDDNKLSLSMNYEGGQFFPGGHWNHSANEASLLSDEYPFWAEVARTHQPLLVNQRDAVPGLPSSEWYRTRGIQSVLSVPLLLGEEAIGCFTIRSTTSPQYRTAELDMAQAIAQQVTLALQMSRLAEQERRAAILQERNRMAQDIHDSLAQSFTGVIVHLEAVGHAPDQEQSNQHIILAQQIARQGLQEARRSVLGLRPEAIDGENLPNALAHLARQMSSAASIQIHFQSEGTPYGLTEMVEDQLFRIAQEALANAVKHSEATEIWVTLRFEPQRVQLCVRDNGKGFQLETGFQGNGFGLIGMHERAELIGGQLIFATEPGQGTSVTVSVPLT